MKQTWQMLLRIAVFQCVVALLGALILLALMRKDAAVAFLVGGSTVLFSTLGAAVLGLRHAASPLDSLAKVLSATITKWLLVLLVMYLAVARWQLPALALLLGLVAAHLSAIFVGLRQRRY